MTKQHALLLLTITLLAASVLFASPSVRAQNTTTAPSLPRLSATTMVPDFYASGTSGSLTLRMSAAGGSLQNGPHNTPLTAWGYVTAQWTTGKVYIIFLANITQSDFTIAFLYIDNSTNPFLLRMYTYGDESPSLLTFQGTQRIYSKMVTTTSVPVPQMNIAAKAQTDGNDLCAIGPGIYLDRSYGQIINGSTTLQIYPLYNQYYQASNDYNELWSLFADQAGNYYFGILYMRNNDADHVILQHLLRLNDYEPMSGITFNAQWSLGFGGSLTLRLPISNATVNVDGFPFQTNPRGIASVDTQMGPTVIEVPNEITPTAGGKLRFTSWSQFGTANPLSLKLNSSLDLTANYTTEYQLVVQSDFGQIEGGGWYTKGTNATFSVPGQVSSDNGTRRVFNHWEGDLNSPSSQGWIVMNNPKQVKADWITQFKVTLQLQGAPPNSTINVTVNQNPLQIQPQNPNDLWVNQNNALAIQVQTTSIQQTTVNYNFTDILVNNSPGSGSVVIVEPSVITLVYSADPKTPASINMTINPTSGVAGYPLTISGSLQPQVNSPSVQIFYSTDRSNWQQIAAASLGPDGKFVYSWTATDAGTYFVKALWAGDNQYTPASQVVSVKVLQAPFSNLADSNTLVSVAQLLKEEAYGIPLLIPMFRFASSLLLLGFLVGTTLIPGGSTLLGYFIGSLILGFVIIFPISTAILAIKAARSRRAPSLLWLTPLATIWLATLGIVLTGTFVASPLLSDAAGVLLVSSNALMLPITASILVAKGVVG